MPTMPTIRSHCQMPIAYYQMPTIRLQLADAYYQMPSIRCQLSDANYQMTTIRCQLSDDYYQIPTIRSQPSDAYYEMPTIMPNILLKYGYLVLMSYRGCCQNPISQYGSVVEFVSSEFDLFILTECWQNVNKIHTLQNDDNLKQGLM